MVAIAAGRPGDHNASHFIIGIARGGCRSTSFRSADVDDYGNVVPRPIHESHAPVATLQSVPASIGALLRRSQLGLRSEEWEKQDGEYEGETGYLHELFMMLVGSLFLSLNVAPTDEMILIAYKISPFHTACIALISVTLMHGFVYALHFKGSHSLSEGMPRWEPFIRFTIPGYVIAIVVSIYALWTFERLDHTSLSQILTAAIILGFPASIGAAAARLIL